MTKFKRLRTGWYPGNHSIRERQMYAALADRVGHKQAPDYADHIINWRLGRPPDQVLARWLQECEDNAWTVEDGLRARIEARVDRFHKQDHITFVRQMIKAGRKAMSSVEETGDMAQPVILKYIADGVNQGMMLHSPRRQEEQMSVGGLTINIGNKPPQRKLRPRQVEQLIEGTFTEIPTLASGNPDD